MNRPHMCGRDRGLSRSESNSTTPRSSVKYGTFQWNEGGAQ